MRMKGYLLLSVICSCHLLQSAAAGTNLLSIHLVAKDAKEEAKLWDWQTNTANLRLMSPPVLADADFVSFDWTNQTFVITAQAAQRLARAIYGREGRAPTLLRNDDYQLIVCPAPFVMKAFDEPVYMGAFWSDIFSYSFDGPVIYSREFVINSNLTANVTFDIKFDASSAEPGVVDPRRDRRILGAVQRLFSYEKR